MKTVRRAKEDEYAGSHTQDGPMVCQSNMTIWGDQATGWTTGVRFSAGAERDTFLFAALGPTQPPIQWVPGSISLVIKRLGR